MILVKNKYTDYNNVLEDCIDLHEKKNVRTVICDGHITDFVKE